MKELFFLRHGKSDWDSGAARDHDRPLAPRGRKAAARVGEALSSLDRTPDRILTSSALRARDTAERTLSAGAWACPIEVVPALYGASPEQVLTLLRAQSSDVQRLLLAGHEPTLSTSASRLIGGGHLRVVTAALVEIHFPFESWSQVAWGTGELIWLQPPKRMEPG